MPTSKPKSNVAKSKQLTKFKFRWWMALILVGAVAVIGIVIIKFSHAGTSYTDFVVSKNLAAQQLFDIHLQSSGEWRCQSDSCFRYNGGPNGNNVGPWTATCAHISYQGYIDLNLKNAPIGVGSAVTVLETGTKSYSNNTTFSCSSYK